MKTNPHSNHRTFFAFTLLEMMIVLGVAVLLFLMFIPRSTGCKAKVSRIQCVNNLKQVGLSYRLWAGDNGENYPMQVTVARGGTMELISAGFVASHFIVLSNELATPKILFCPDDKDRAAAASFSGTANLNISYFVGLNAASSDPEAWLAGDRNVTNASAPVRGVLVVPTNSAVGWTEKMHNRNGDVCLADGSVQQFSNRRLNDSLRSQTNSPLRLAMPE